MNNYQKLELIHSAIEEAYNGKFREIDDGFEEIPLYDNSQTLEKLSQALELVEDLKEKEKEKVSLEEVKHWMGSDWSFDDTCETLQELANGIYKQDQLLEDIKNTAESTGFYTEVEK